MPTETPTWRKVSLTPAAMPLRSFATTLTATSAITGLTRPIPAPAIRKPASRVVQCELAWMSAISSRPRPTPARPTQSNTRACTRDRSTPAIGAAMKLATVIGRQRRVAEIVLQIQRQVQEQRKHRAGDRERRELRAGERAPPKQAEREHRLGDPTLDHDERDQQHGGAREKRDDQRAAPPLVVSPNERQHQAEQGGAE